MLKFFLLLLFLLATGCAKVALQTSAGPPAPPPVKVKKVKIDPLQEKKCLNGDGQVCYLIGSSYQNAQEVKSSFKYFEIGCNLDHGDSCFQAGKLKESHNAPLESELFFRKACRFKNGDACLSISQLIESRKKVLRPVETQEKEKQDEKENNQDKDEQLLGNTQQGEFIEFDDHEGDVLLFLIHSCDYKSREGCMRLGFYYDEKNESEKAFVFFRRACYLDQVAGCFNAGVMKSKLGQEALGLEFYLLGCDKKNAEACYNLACFYSKKEQVDKGFTFLERALNFGFKDWEKLQTDDNLATLRNLPKFTELVEKARSKN